MSETNEGRGGGARQRASAREAGTLPRSERAQEIAAFDFDKTLSTRDNVLPFLRAAVGGPRLIGALASASALLAAAAIDDRRRDAVKATLVRRTLTGYEAERLAIVAVRFAEVVIARHLRPEIVERVAWHREQGHELVVVSASFADYLTPIAAHLGIHAVLATELEVGQDGLLTGRLACRNVRGAEKVRRLDVWLGDRPAFVWAYGDSAGDRELFARADRAIRVDRRRRRPSR